MEIAVDRGDSVARWENLTSQKENLENKLQKARNNALAEGRDPTKDDEVRKYEFHLGKINQAMRRFRGSPF